MARSTFFNAPAINVTIDGSPSTLFAKDFNFRVTTPDDQSAVTVGTAGNSTSLMSNTSAELEVSYQSTSPSLDQLYQLWVNQRKGNGKLFDIHITTGVGETISCNGCSVKKASDFEGGNNEQVDRVFTFNVQDFEPDASLFTS